MKNKNKEVKSYFTIGEFLAIFFTILFSCTLTLIIFLSNIDVEIDATNILTILKITGHFLLISLIISSIIYFGKMNFIINPLKKVSEAARKVANGDFTAKIKYKKKNKITYTEQLYNDFNKMVDELASTEMLKDDFISSVSHEIKTPLSVIQSYTSAIQDKSIDEEKQQEYLKIIIEQSGKLSTLITNILRLNKLEHQEIPKERCEFYASEQIKSSIINFEDLWTNKNIKFNMDIDDIKIESEEEILEIVWNNLLSNAIKFTKDRITVSVKEDNDNVVIKIKDNGCGMSEDTIRHIYDKFYQGDTSHSKEGNGLGLALTLRAIQIVGGRIDVESKINKGTTFTVTLKK